MRELVSWNHKMTTKPMLWPFLLGFLPITAHHTPFPMAMEKPSARVCWQVIESAVCTRAEAQGTDYHMGTHRITDLLLLLLKWLRFGNLGGAWDSATLPLSAPLHAVSLLYGRERLQPRERVLKTKVRLGNVTLVSFKTVRHGRRKHTSDCLISYLLILLP